MKIKVCFTSEKKPDFTSRMIMKIMRTSYSHVFFVHKGNIYHSVGEGVCVEPYEKYLESHDLVEEFDVDLVCTEEVFEAFMDGEKEKEYSMSQYLGFVIPFMQKYVDNNNAKRICSELVAVALQNYGKTKYTFTKDLDFTNPKDVYEILKASVK